MNEMNYKFFTRHTAQDMNSINQHYYEARYYEPCVGCKLLLNSLILVKQN